MFLSAISAATTSFMEKEALYAGRQRASDKLVHQK